MAKTCDTLRVLLPAGTRSNLGIYATGQSYEQLLMRLAVHPLAEMREYGELMKVELRKVIPEFLKRVDVEERGVAWSKYWDANRERVEELTARVLSDAGAKPEHRDEVTLVDFDPEGETKIAAAVLYWASAMPDDQLLALARSMPREQVAEILRASVGDRSNRRHKPGRSWERTSYRFDVLCDYGAFRDLQRHRPLTIEWQRLTTEHGYQTPPQIDEAGLRADWERVMQASAETERALLDAGFVEQAQYAVSMAYRIRFVMQMTAREAMHLTELRSQPAGHPVYRRGRADDAPADRRRAPRDRRDVQLRERRRGRPGAARGGTPHGGEAQGDAGRAHRGVTSPGSVTAVVRGDAIDLGVHGAPSAHTGDQLTPEAIFYVGSIAKQFVAACVALLEHDGTFRLDHPVSRFVPRLPSWGDRVTIRHLVHHTGGVKERRRTGPGVPIDGVPSWGNADLLDELRRIAELDFEPGSRYGYSNRGYLLLAEVVAAASGASLADVARERIFEPLGMRDTFFRETETPLPERAVRGHFEAHDGNVYEEPRASTRSAPAGSGRPSPISPRGAGTSTRIGSPTDGSPSGSRPAARSTTARRSTTPGACRCAAIGACRSSVTAATSRLGGEDGALPHRGFDHDRAREPGGSRRQRDGVPARRRGAGGPTRPRRSPRRRHVRRRGAPGGGGSEE